MSAQRYSLAQAASKFFGNDVITECDWTLADVQLDALHASGFKIVREAADGMKTFHERAGDQLKEHIEKEKTRFENECAEADAIKAIRAAGLRIIRK